MEREIEPHSAGLGARAYCERIYLIPMRIDREGPLTFSETEDYRYSATATA
jgi:hypothetical protein